MVRYIGNDSEASGRDYTTVLYQDLRAGTEDIHRILSQDTQCHGPGLSLALSENDCK